MAGIEIQFVRNVVSQAFGEEDRRRHCATTRSRKTEIVHRCREHGGAREPRPDIGEVVAGRSIGVAGIQCFAIVDFVRRREPEQADGVVAVDEAVLEPAGPDFHFGQRHRRGDSGPDVMRARTTLHNELDA